ncbi:MAG: hypothetical protein ABI895_18120 [Deltaproteobacteria bacterium]
MQPTQVTVCRSNSDYVVGFTNGLAIAFWRHETLAEYVGELQATAVRARKACGQPIALIQVVPPGSITPDGRARAALVQMLRELKNVVSYSAIVHEAEGFRAAMIRSIVTGVAALSNPGFPHRVFAKLPEAAGWIGENHALLSPELISSAVAKVRAAIAPAKGTGATVAESP